MRVNKEEQQNTDNSHPMNIGIVAHVDAGKTSVSERLLFLSGVIAQIGRVDSGSTQTDSLQQEKERGITIKTAVAAMEFKGRRFNLIDTPGHSDFASEVQRSLSVLDIAILVISACEGVQSRTRILARVLKDMNIPFIVFVNKVDRKNANPDRVLSQLQSGLIPNAVMLSKVDNPGTQNVSSSLLSNKELVGYEDLIWHLLEANPNLIVDEDKLESIDMLRLVFQQTVSKTICPVIVGSAFTGAGFDDLLSLLIGIKGELKSEGRGTDSSGTVFKLLGDGRGHRIALIRMWSGTLSRGQTLRISSLVQDEPKEVKLSEVSVYKNGTLTSPGDAYPGEIASVVAKNLEIGDSFGDATQTLKVYELPPPMLEAVAYTKDVKEKQRLYEALHEMSNEDPFINFSLDEQDEMSIKLYGEVQKEVIQRTLEDDYGIRQVSFRPSTVVYIERVVGIGEALEEIGSMEYIKENGNPDFWATIGLRVERNSCDDNLFYGGDNIGRLPLSFYQAVIETISNELRAGPYGWQVESCKVIFTKTGYASTVSTAGDFRLLTPLILAKALNIAKTVVCEPINSFEITGISTDNLSTIQSELSRYKGVVTSLEQVGDEYVLMGEIPVVSTNDFALALPELTSGRGAISAMFTRYKELTGLDYPVKPRGGANPYNRAEYMRLVKSATRDKMNAERKKASNQKAKVRGPKPKDKESTRADGSVVL